MSEMYSKKSFKLKGNKDLVDSDIKKAFNHNNLIVINTYKLFIWDRYWLIF